MYYSKMLLPTLKETPAEAETVSHQLLLRAGMIRKLTSGIYDYLPLGLMVLRKVEAIVREEMNCAGAQELLLPAVQPAELWQESGRWQIYGKELLRFQDRHDRDYCFGPTHEEVITDLVRREVHSYRQLPLNLYQIQTKFRDEIRPRFGLIRGREFIMKDGYSFDIDEAGADQTYRAMYDAYTRIFSRCGLRFKTVEADSGPIGGSFSHEFMVLAETGEDVVVSCTACAYAANLEKAEILPTESSLPVEPLLPLEKVHTPGVRSVSEVADFLQTTPDRVLKTMIYQTDEGAVAVLLRGDHEVNEVKLKNFLQVSELFLAPEEVIRQETNAAVGFAGPVGLNLPIYADYGLGSAVNLVAGANENDYHIINVNFDRDLVVKGFADLRQASNSDPCPRCGAALEFLRGIEVGHVFKLGYKYSKALKATFLDDQGREQYMFMGCYGIGVSRIVAAAIEQNHDLDGIIFPMPLAPFQVLLVPIAANDVDTMAVASRLYQEIRAAGIEVLFDDRNERPGIKFKDGDLLGIPVRVVLGPKTLAQGAAEVRQRRSRAVQLIPLASLVAYLQDHIQAEMIRPT
ncbi:proline--tRNA ligase [Desulfobacca acetoxidans]|uniref:Proline--tRNA ligase n=1 Tax=Desulfobacca acetoxidans (strain ATCC 700848 / DSM 11109 / ASRB2) TaxID=880072 RepID=F2NFU8_DESAR|nr:proline--tRNA ligase [Desulfobacca acetoxidans]AEB10217.1 Prolyl-tRNA synthetase [Desulfobacca acetoxidans DSM 11109]